MKRETIVVGFDGSECAERALDAAISLADEDSTIHVVVAYDAPTNRYITELYATVPAEFTANIDLLAAPRQTLDDAVHIGRAARRVKCQRHLVDDDPGSAILDTAKEVGADLVVVGSRGRGRAAQLLRGSVSIKVAHHCPVDFPRRPLSAPSPSDRGTEWLEPRPGQRVNRIPSINAPGSLVLAVVRRS